MDKWQEVIFRGGGDLTNGWPKNPFIFDRFENSVPKIYPVSEFSFIITFSKVQVSKHFSQNDPLFTQNSISVMCSVCFNCLPVITLVFGGK